MIGRETFVGICLVHTPFNTDRLGALSEAHLQK